MTEVKRKSTLLLFYLKNKKERDNGIMRETEVLLCYLVSKQVCQNLLCVGPHRHDFLLKLLGFILTHSTVINFLILPYILYLDRHDGLNLLNLYGYGFRNMAG